MKAFYKYEGRCQMASTEKTKAVHELCDHGLSVTDLKGKQLISRVVHRLVQILSK